MRRNASSGIEWNGSIGEAWREIRADYDAAKDSRFRRTPSGVSWSGTGADYHISETALMRMIELARHYDRNDPIVGQAVNRLIDNIFQQGFTLDPDTGDGALDVDLRARWDNWANDPDQCDVAGELTFEEMAALHHRAVLVDGDVFVLAMKSGHLQSIEAHRVRTPRATTRNVVLGVLLDDYRRRLEYWATKDNISPLTQVNRVNEIIPYAARDKYGARAVLHLYMPKRISQTRGVSVFAPVANMIGQFDDLAFAMLVKAQVASAFAIFREMGPGSPATASAAVGATTTETLSDGTTRSIEGIAPGMEIQGRAGEKLHGFSPNIPNPEFFPHATLILSVIAVNLGIPIHTLLLDASKTNFSGWRGATDQSRMGLGRQQRFSITHERGPVYRWKLRQWIADDPVIRRAAERIGPRFFQHDIIPPYWPYIEPAKDAIADERICSAGLNSRRQVLARRGLRIEDVDRDRVSDHAALISAAINAANEINSANPDAGVTWRDIIQDKTAAAAIPAETEPVQPEGFDE